MLSAGSSLTVKVVTRKRAASALPPSASQLVSGFLLGFLLQRAARAAELCPAGMSPPLVRVRFLAWGSGHVGEMGSVPRAAPHNREILRTETWGGKADFF